MDRNILGGVLAIPLLVVSGNLVSGATCDFTKPDLVYERACIDEACLRQVRKHLPACQNKLAGHFTKTIRHDEGVETAPYLSFETMDRLNQCIATASFGAFDAASVDLSRFSEVSKDVRGENARRVGGDCPDGKCSGLYMLPIVGETTFLHGPVKGIV